MEALKVQYREYKAVKPGSYRAKIKAVEQKPSTFQRRRACPCCRV
jgi:hypothetical protein